MDDYNNNQQPPYEQPPQQQQYQQPPQQQYDQSYQQQQYQQPAPQQGARPATEGEKNGLFSVSGGLLMLIFTIIATVNLAIALFSSLPMSIFSNVLPILTVVGLWLCYTNAKKQKLNKIGPTLIRVPFIINFILAVIVYGLVLIVCFMGFATAGAAASSTESEASAAIGGNIMVVFVVVMLFVAAAFVLEILYFRSVNNCLKNSIGLNQGYGINKQAGMFAAIVTIIKAVLGFIPGAAVAFISLGGGALFDSLFEALNMEMLSGVMDMLKSFGVMSLISSIITLAYNVMSGVMILQFCKKTSEGAYMA